MEEAEEEESISESKGERNLKPATEVAYCV